MSRVKDLQKQVYKTLAKCIDDKQDCAKAVAHLHGVSLAAAIIAKKRGEDPELAAMAGLLHDLYAYNSGSYDDHARKGADLAKKVLSDLGSVSNNEIDTICSAIWHHNDKENTDSPMDEVLKDADVIDHSLTDPTKAVKEHEMERFLRLCEEFGLA